MLIGNNLATQKLKKLVCDSQAHTIILSGPAGVGKKRLAKMAVEWSAGQVIKKILPDLLIVSPDKESKNTIGKPKASLVLKHLSRKAIMTSKKYVIIEQAHLLTKEAGNSLLISLEEPKGDSLIILTTANTASLLPTILSRSIVVRLGRVAPEIIKKELMAIDNTLKPKVMEPIIAASHGLPEIALALLQNSKALNNYIRINKDLSLWLKADVSERLKICQSYTKDKKSTLRFIHELYYRASFTQKRGALRALGRLKNNVAPKTVLEELCMIK